jgi:hypothetical protein
MLTTHFLTKGMMAKNYVTAVQTTSTSYLREYMSLKNTKIFPRSVGLDEEKLKFIFRV